MGLEVVSSTSHVIELWASTSTFPLLDNRSPCLVTAAFQEVVNDAEEVGERILNPGRSQRMDLNQSLQGRHHALLCQGVGIRRMPPLETTQQETGQRSREEGFARDEELQVAQTGSVR